MHTSDIPHPVPEATTKDVQSSASFVVYLKYLKLEEPFRQCNASIFTHHIFAGLWNGYAAMDGGKEW